MTRCASIRVESLSLGSVILGRGRVVDVFCGARGLVHFFTVANGWEKAPYGTMVTVRVGS